MILGLGCGSSAPAAQEPAPEPEPSAAVSEPAQEPAQEPANEPAQHDTVAADDGPAVEQAQGDTPQPGQLDIGDANTERAPTPAPAPEPTGKLLQLIQDAEAAGKEGRYAKAHRLCSQALEIEPGQPRALIICAIAACNLDNTRQARRYYAQAPTKEQQTQIYQICRSKGIELR
jgi:hypothetical protein